MTRRARHVLLLTAAMLSFGGLESAQAALNLPRIAAFQKREPFTNCVNLAYDIVGGSGAQAIGQFGTDGTKTRNLRSSYLTAPVAPTFTPTGERARTPIKYLSSQRPEGVLLGAGYNYVLNAAGQESVQFDHLVIRAPYRATSGVARGKVPVAGFVRLTLGETVYEGEAKVSRGGLEFYITAAAKTGVGYMQLRSGDQALFARAAASQTPMQVVVMDTISHAELYRATVSMAQGLQQKALMDQALSQAASFYAKGYDSPLCHPDDVTVG